MYGGMAKCQPEKEQIMPDYAIYKLKISVLTPVHIGNGRELLNEYDYAIHAGQTWRINDALLLESQDVEDPSVGDRLANTPPAQLLGDKDFTQDNPVFRYVIKGVPRSSAEGAQVHEQLKDSFDRVYIPGSSLKGALRTLLAWHAWEAIHMKPEVSQLGDKPKYAGQNYEHRLFVQPDVRRGHEPNFDMLKAVQISDSNPLDANCLLLVNASVLNRSGQTGPKSIPVEMEAIRSNTTFECTLKLDLALFSNWAHEYGLHLVGEEWLKKLPEIGRARARDTISREIAWFRSMSSAQRLLSAYQQLGQSRLAGNQFPMKLGWGTGWDDKTIGSRLQEDPAFMGTIIGRYSMARGRRNINDPFPKSRRAAMITAQSTQGQRVQVPAVPLGWILITIEPTGKAGSWIDLGQKPEMLLPPGSIQPTAPRPAEPVRRPAGKDVLPESENRVSLSERQPERPSVIEPAPAAQPKRVVVEQFTKPPQIGDRFWGEVFDVDGRNLYLSIPGLDADTVAYAFIPAIENMGGKKHKEGDRILCEVVDLKQEPNKTWQIICTMD
jgi:CRISPR-associated protein Csm5